MSNPLVCNCQMKWLKDWLLANNLATGNLKCSYPSALNGKVVTSLENDVFKGCSEENTDSCATQIQSDKIILKSSSSAICPKNCTCRDNIVRCSRSVLQNIPEGIASSVLEL